MTIGSILEGASNRLRGKSLFKALDIIDRNLVGRLCEEFKWDFQSVQILELGRVAEAFAFVDLS